MRNSTPAKQFSFRLPPDLVERVEDCTEVMRANGLAVTRADVVRMLIAHALEATKCRLDLLLKPLSRRRVRKK